MRIDNGSPGPTQAPELDARAKLKRYLQAIQRHWYLIAIFAVIGAGLGWVSAPETEAPEIIVKKSTYYEATHTLIRNEATGNAMVAPISLSQAAFLVGKGEVPVAVAEQLDIDVADVEGAVAGIPRNEVSSIEVQAVDKDPDRAVAMADASAQELLKTLQAQATRDFEAARDDIVTGLDELDNQISMLNAQIATDPPNRPQLEAQQRSATNQYALAYEQFTQLANQPPPTPGLDSLQGAKATKIDEDRYNEIKDAIRDGLPYVTGAQPVVVEPASGGGASPGPGAGATTRSIVGLIVGLGAATALILGLDRFDNRLRHRDDVERASGLTVLAEIPPLKRSQQTSHEVVAHAQHRSRAAEAYRVVRSALLFAVETGATARRADGDGLVVMITSANPAEGKTTTTANLAAVMAEGGFTVLVVNCDFRRPRVQDYLIEDGSSNERHTVLDSTSNTSPVVVTATKIAGVKLVTGIGENDPNANPLEVVATQRKVIQAARGSYDVVLLDTAPFLTTNDASELLSETDQVVLVVRAGSTREGAAHRTAEVLERLDAPVLGVVLNDSSETPAAQYYYNYYEADRGKAKAKAATSPSTMSRNAAVPQESDPEG